MLKPLFARVIVEREVLKSKTLIIPQVAEKKNAPAIGKIIAVGPTVDESIKKLIGKTVVFGMYAGDWFRDGDRDVYVLMDEDIIAEVT